MSELSLHEVMCLQYLSDKMEATGEMIGEAVEPHSGRTPRGKATIGNKVARALLRVHGECYVTWLSDLRAWRITSAGRARLASELDTK